MERGCLFAVAGIFFSRPLALLLGADIETLGMTSLYLIKFGMYYANITIGVLSLVIYLLIFLFADGITGVFNGENNLQMQAISVTGLKLYFLSAVFVGYNTILAVFFTSTENALPAHALSLLRGIVLLVPMAFILSRLWGMNGIWLTCPLTEGVAAAVGYTVYRKNRL